MVEQTLFFPLNIGRLIARAATSDAEPASHPISTPHRFGSMIDLAVPMDLRLFEKGALSSLRHAIVLQFEAVVQEQ